MSCLCKRYNAFRGKSLLMAQTIPVALCIRLFFIWKICFFTIPNVKEITQELYPFSLDSVSHKSCCRNLKKLSEKIQKRLLRAGELIRAGVPVMKAAEQAGFEEYSTFLRAFRGTFHMSPREFR